MHTPSQGYTYTELENQTFHNTVCLHRDSECLYTAIHFRPHTDPTLLSPLPQLSLSLSGCSAGWLTSRAAGLGGGCPVYQSISRLGAQRGGRQAGRQAVSQAVWWRAEGLMRVSERRSPTFPRRLAAGRACGGGGSPLSHDLSSSCAHLGAIHFLPETSLPLQLQEGGGG